MVDAAKDSLKPPGYVALLPAAVPYFDGVVRTRARDEWTETDLIVAVQLAQCMSDIADEDAELRVEGKVITNERGTPVMNPRTTVLEQLARREMALMRTLRMGGRIAGDARNEAGARKVERQSRKLREELAKDDLLAS